MSKMKCINILNLRTKDSDLGVISLDDYYGTKENP